MEHFFNFLRIGYQVLGQFLHLKARGTFGYIIRVTLFFDAEWITLEPNKEKRKKQKPKKDKKEIFPHQDSNSGPTNYQSSALPIELSHQT